MSLKAWVCLLLVVFVTLPVAAAVHVPMRGHWALVIGNADYSKFPLQYTIADAFLVEEVLEKAGFQVDRILEATYCETAWVFADLARKLAAEREENPGIEQVVVIYYSGHGAAVKDTSGDEADGLDGAIVPVDWDYDAGHMVPDDILSTWLDQLGPATTVVVILDCGNMGAQGLTGPGRMVLVGSSKDQCAFDNEALGHGVFTYYLVEGLQKGEKDTDGKVSLQEAFWYAQEQVKEYAEDWYSREVEPEMSDGISVPLFLFDDPSKCPTPREADQSGGPWGSK